MLNFKQLDHSELVAINDKSNELYGRVALVPLTSMVYTSNIDFNKSKELLGTVKSDLLTVYNDTITDGLMDFIEYIHKQTNLNQGVRLTDCLIVVEHVKTETIEDTKQYHGSFDLDKVMYVYGFHLVEVG